jgi:GT2 family glycosyltransferase
MNQKTINSVAVVISTTGRSEIVSETIHSIAKLKKLPKCVIIVGSSSNDLPSNREPLPFEIILMIGSFKGLTKQRNQGISKVADSIKYVCFLDDDMELHQEYFYEVERVFESDKKIVGFSGGLIANGNIVRTAARKMLESNCIHPGMPFFGFYPKKWPGFYGCNMNIRRDLLEIEQFDENLPLSAIGEDCEMGFRLSRYGYVGGSGRCSAVHLSTRSGRISEVGVGYAQVINYLYFANKNIGFPKFSTYFNKIIKTPIVNFIFWILPILDSRKQIDRKGRFLGNLEAIKDISTGKIDPMRLFNILNKTNLKH